VPNHFFFDCEWNISGEPGKKAYLRNMVTDDLSIKTFTDGNVRLSDMGLQKPCAVYIKGCSQDLIQVPDLL